MPHRRHRCHMIFAFLWLPSLNVIVSGSIHVAARIFHSFFIAEKYSIIYKLCIPLRKAFFFFALLLRQWFFFKNFIRLSVQFSRSVVSHSLWPHELQHARPPCPSPTPRVYPNSCPLSQWCHPTILCRPLLLLPSIFPSIRVFSSESVLRIRWPKYWSFSFNISPSNEHPGLVSFRMDWLDLLAVQGTLKSFLQQHSSKASILRRSAFFIVQLSHPFMTTGKTIALTRRTFVGKVMSLLFNMHLGWS